MREKVARERCPWEALPTPLPDAILSDPRRIFDGAITPNPSARPFIRQRSTGPFWYGKWSRNGESVVRALGRAWAESDGSGGWRMKRGRPPEGTLTEAAAGERMLTLVREHDADQTLLERDAEEPPPWRHLPRAGRGVSALARRHQGREAVDPPGSPASPRRARHRLPPGRRCLPRCGHGRFGRPIGA